MAVSVQPIPMFSDNYAWLLHESGTGTTAIVDPADEDEAFAALDAAGLKLDLILLTHHHQDHIAGADAVRTRTGARIVGAAADARRLPRLDQAVREGDTVRIGNAQARVLETPGHTLGHISFFLPDGALLFCGDTLFSLGCGRLLEGTAEDMFASLAKLARLPGETQIFCGHEYTESNARFALSIDPRNEALCACAGKVASLREADKPSLPSRLADELAANPFMRARTAQRLGEIRAAKDAFRG